MARGARVDRQQRQPLFSDTQPGERIFKLTPPATVPTLLVEASGSNGLALDSADQLIMADQGKKRIRESIRSLEW